MHELLLKSPVGSFPLLFQWDEENLTECKCAMNNIINIIRFMCNVDPEMKRQSVFWMDKDLNTNNYLKMKSLCENFNRSIESLHNAQNSGLNSIMSRPECLNEPSDSNFLSCIMKSIYDKSVTDPKKLNRYKPFSAEVYGETTFEFIHQLIGILKMTKKDTFIDLGSGVGHIVLQVAAATDCRISYGIEQADIPAAYAKNMSIHFKKIMSWFGKKFRHYLLLKGNFLDQKFHDYISRATVIFVNNLMFSPEFDNKLSERFHSLEDGTRIVSSKSYVKKNFQISGRNLDSIGAIMDVQELQGSGSWTGQPVTFYLHTINRSKLHNYWINLEQNSSKKRKTGK